MVPRTLQLVRCLPRRAAPPLPLHPAKTPCPAWSWTGRAPAVSRSGRVPFVSRGASRFRGALVIYLIFGWPSSPPPAFRRPPRPVPRGPVWEEAALVGRFFILPNRRYPVKLLALNFLACEVRRLAGVGRPLHPSLPRGEKRPRPRWWTGPAHGSLGRETVAPSLWGASSYYLSWVRLSTLVRTLGVP